ncbi:RAMP superfamily CRISPR-associated protein [Clostridium tagluense]|uniref:RAMP superfamily CRISPR-associated protein n=1 Tax=Clostridium tagluense TaxID=360422 RepID=UPI001CF4EF16|nr:RAMP superfamily CRISPR-associated protein [Clostridium tagluense]MCB2312914.1 RAMP superfamily CRISPR-associated protein [Clostridium tagluense]MCB2317680.1 RAMP superfamily CRISPR-associated protein [Clostridium tagluense]MCB2322486.1 RAMP superfamily CRISPR-associated protein [Clostridium tagluense]MCB2327488.1 RAMP superfamily CRISPR-associated protein [Clostridium tagluense]MCB2332207.1 RAMP superfamily CRISPR-associated protein [Clostridium tagluense]
MNRYPISIELISETIFGNGESKNGIVNTEILLDGNGFPYLMGKTFKGYLKNAIINILKPYYDNKNDGNFKTKMQQIFGAYDYIKKQESDKDAGEQVEGEVRFTNFYIEKSIAALFLGDIKNQKDIIVDSLTDIRFSIKVEEGVAKDKSLRAARVLKKGLIFTGYIETEKPLSEKDYEFLKQGTKALKNLGINKSRGKGLVKVELGGLEVDTINQNIINETNFEYIFYEINLKEPIKIGDSQSQYDYEESKSYISGSTIRGAVLSKYLKYNNIKPQNADKNIGFNTLLKKVKFYDAYPVFIKEEKKYYSFPTPNIYRITKDIDKDDGKIYNEKQYSIVFENKKIEDERRVIKLKKGEFSYYQANKLYQFNIKKEYRFHHTQEKDKENIFRYESISKEQKFYGIINVSSIDKDLKNNLHNLISENGIVYLGGSRTSGYGKSEMCNIELVEDFESLKDKLVYLKANINKKNTDIYFLSDAILRADEHQITSNFSEKYMKENLNIKLGKIKQKYEISPVIITGFNNKWKSMLPQVTGIEKGSVIRLEKCNRLCKDKVNDFMKKHHGDRSLDGLGRVIINPDFFNATQIYYVEQEAVINDDTYSVSKIDDLFLQTIKKYRNEMLTNKAIKKYIAEGIDDKLTSKDLEKLSNSKINNIISTIDKCLLTEEPIKEFEKELDKLSVITQNEEKNKNNMNFRNVRISENYTIGNLVRLAEDKKQNIMQGILQNIENPYSYEYVLLKVVRDKLYYSLKASKRGEDDV